MLWVDKYRPNNLSKMDIHQELSTQLENVSKNDDFPHMLFFGPTGAGKKTKINAFLKSVYGSKVEKVKVDFKEMKVGASGSKEVTITVCSSPYHIVLNPSEVGYYDRWVVSSMIKEIAQSVPLTSSTDEKKFKIVVLHEVDKLTKEAQQALRRTMEKYMKSCRIILSASSTSQIISPILSRCLQIQVSAPKEKEIEKILKKIVKSEGVKIGEKDVENISKKCDNNLRRAIFMLELMNSEKNSKIPEIYWEKYIHDIAKDVMEEQSPKRILQVRTKMYSLMTNCIPPELILKKLSEHLMSLDIELQHQVSHWAGNDKNHLIFPLAFYEHRLICGSKAIFHLEAFIAKFMSVYKKISQEMMEFEE
eukprot:gene6601-10764_t